MRWMMTMGLYKTSERSSTPIAILDSPKHRGCIFGYYIHAIVVGYAHQQCDIGVGQRQTPLVKASVFQASLIGQRQVAFTRWQGSCNQIFVEAFENCSADVGRGPAESVVACAYLSTIIGLFFPTSPLAYTHKPTNVRHFLPSSFVSYTFLRWCRSWNSCITRSSCILLR